MLSFYILAAMASICLCFQIHQPLRIRKYSVFEIGKHTPYFDQAENRKIFEQTSQDVYEPWLRCIEKLASKLDNEFQVCLSISGTALEQIEAWRPSIIHRLKSLLKQGTIEILGSTYYHSLAFEYSRPEFLRQINLHKEKIENLFGESPVVFKNTGFLFHNPLAYFLKQEGFQGIITEGAPQMLGTKHPNTLYHASHLPDFALILRNYHLSDDISIRYSDPSWEHFPLSAHKFAEIFQGNEGANSCLALDLEVLGSSSNNAQDIFGFMENFPTELLARGNKFISTRILLSDADSKPSLDVPYPISGLGEDKDKSVWMGNSRQQEALRKIYEMESLVMESDNEGLIQDWSYLQTAEHFYYMSNASALVQVNSHEGIANSTPFSSPDEAYTHYMNLIADFQIRLREL